jgi:hypothetical protein
MHSEYLRQPFLSNELAEGRVVVADRLIALTDVRAPIHAADPAVCVITIMLTEDQSVSATPQANCPDAAGGVEDSLALFRL